MSKDQVIVVFKSNYTLHTIFANSKNKVDDFEKSQIYKIEYNDCDNKYFGQTQRSIKTRFREQFAHLRYERSENLVLLKMYYITIIQ